MSLRYNQLIKVAVKVSEFNYKDNLSKSVDLVWTHNFGLVEDQMSVTK